MCLFEIAAKACSEVEAFQIATSDEKISKYIAGKAIKKRIYVPRRIMNVIIEQQNLIIASASALVHLSESGRVVDRIF
jgi:hypothetical protein